MTSVIKSVGFGISYAIGALIMITIMGAMGLTNSEGFFVFLFLFILHNKYL